MAGSMTPSQNNTVHYKLEGVENYYVSKPFFKHYHFKLIYDFSAKPENINGIAYASVQTKMSSRNIATNAAISIMQMLPNVDFKHRVEYGKLSMFLRTYGDFLLVAKHFPDKIISATMPMNNKQSEVMNEDGTSTVFKNALFMNAFRYKVTTKASNEFLETFDAIHAFNSELGEKEFLASNNYKKILNKQHIMKWNTVSMYYNDPHDILMLRFIIGSIHHTIEKCVLFDEIS